MKFIIGRKLDMSQVWQGEKVVAVTRIQAEPCSVTQVKTGDKDGYEAVQLGAGKQKEKNINKPQKGHLKGLGALRKLREFRTSERVNRGDRIDVSTFQPGDTVAVTGLSKGRGFQGVVKRHGFAGAPKTHGTKDQVRMPGAIGAIEPNRVFKGMRMGGRMGGKQVTVSNLEVVDVDKENDLLIVKGGVPGARNSWLMVRAEGDLVTAAAETPVKEEQAEEAEKAEPAEESAADQGPKQQDGQAGAEEGPVKQD